MSNDINPAPYLVIGVLTVALSIGGGMWGCPTYNVWSAEMGGRAELAKADQNREILVRTARAKTDSAKYEAQAEVERAKGIAEANKIVADSLGGPEGYLRWLWINAMKEGKDGNTVVYVPTEAGLPLLESSRLRQGK